VVVVELLAKGGEKSPFFWPSLRDKEKAKIRGGERIDN